MPSALSSLVDNSIMNITYRYIINAIRQIILECFLATKVIKNNSDNLYFLVMGIYKQAAVGNIPHQHKQATRKPTVLNTHST